MDIVTTAVHDPLVHNRQQLTQELSQELTRRLTAAWSATRPRVQPPADWLAAAVTALATAPPTSDADAGGHAAQFDRVDAADVTSWQTIAEQVQLLRAETLEHLRAALIRRAQLTRLQADVRERAIGQLYESPDLEDPLRVALDEWGLPPIDNDDDDENTC